MKPIFEEDVASVPGGAVAAAIEQHLVGCHHGRRTEEPPTTTGGVLRVREVVGGRICLEAAGAAAEHRVACQSRTFPPAGVAPPAARQLAQIPAEGEREHCLDEWPGVLQGGVAGTPSRALRASARRGRGGLGPAAPLLERPAELAPRARHLLHHREDQPAPAAEGGGPLGLHAGAPWATPRRTPAARARRRRCRSTWARPPRCCTRTWPPPPLLPRRRRRRGPSSTRARAHRSSPPPGRPSRARPATPRGRAPRRASAAGGAGPAACPGASGTPGRPARRRAGARRWRSSRASSPGDRARSSGRTRLRHSPLCSGSPRRSPCPGRGRRPRAPPPRAAPGASPGLAPWAGRRTAAG
mmetsp:Transcript_90803/g.257225  ORF Transcript_90803/g.257225 Transcript_90803/m.257225 type:complete len:356 (+) Transcript_90803:230-1297(+)